MGKEFNMGKKVNRNDFLQTVSENIDVPYGVVSAVYEGIADEIINVTKHGVKLSLTGFGAFYAQKHKGHPVQFSDSSETVDDYVVLKFSSSNVMNKRLRDDENTCLRALEAKAKELAEAKAKKAEKKIKA